MMEKRVVWRILITLFGLLTLTSAERNKNTDVDSPQPDYTYTVTGYSEDDKEPDLQDHEDHLIKLRRPYEYPKATEYEEGEIRFSITPSEHPDFKFKDNAEVSYNRVARHIHGDIDAEETKNFAEYETSKNFHTSGKTSNLIKDEVKIRAIRPTRTKHVIDSTESNSSSEMTNSGEEKRASMGRSLPQSEPSIAKLNLNVTRNVSSRSDEDRGNPNTDIQDIINDFVKLLNGNVQVNTNLPPIKNNYPFRTRINNRGPPRISDVPPLIFDSSLQPPSPPLTTPTPSLRNPTPYPFDVPLPPQPFNASKLHIPLPGVATNISKITTGSPRNATSSEAIKPSATDRTTKETSTELQASKKEETTLDLTPTSITSAMSEKAKPSVATSKINETNSVKLENIASVTRADVWSVKHRGNATISKTVPERIKPTTASNVGIVASVPATLGTGNATVADDLQHTTGVGTAVVVLEPSTQEVPSAQGSQKTTYVASTASVSSTIRKRPPSSYSGGNNYFPRPGIVLDDPEYKPAGGSHRRPTTPGIVTAPPAGYRDKDVFDITVSAVQGPGSTEKNSKIGQPFIFPVDINSGGSDVTVITSPQSDQNYVSIDGKRTYLNLFENTNTVHNAVQPTNVRHHGSHSTSVPSISSPMPSAKPGTSSTRTSPSPIWRKPTHPPVRIDTCIVGDDSTCDITQHERCRTELGVSSCHCRPGYNRRKHREPCHRIISLLLSLRVDKMYDQRLLWNEKYAENDTSEYQQLEYETVKAIDSALGMTPFSDLFVGARINNMYTSKNSNTGQPVFINMTIQLLESAETLRAPVKQDLQKHLTGVLQRRNNNVGSSPLWVDSPVGAVSQIHDLDECSSPELNDCHPRAKCTNIFGSFYCTCTEGYRDPWASNNHRSGRMCESCDPSHCNHRGECSFQNGQPICRCVGSYYGAQCEIDGEVLGVAIGSSVLAILIIVTTLACLCAWSRRWSKEQKIGSPVFGYMPSGSSTVKTPVVGAPPYQVSLEDRLRWAQIADAMAHANHYGPEPVGTLRPSSVFGYSLPHSTGPLIMPRLRPSSVHTSRTPESSTSEEEDKADLLGRHFQVPRPKSRSSVANQSGIYYDVDYESQQQNREVFSTMKSGQPTCIPLNTYTMGSRSHYYRH